MSWQEQGRQEHGWFGHGASSLQQNDTTDGDASLFGFGGFNKRMSAVAYGAIASLPPALRAQAARQLNTHIVTQLIEVMAAWTRGIKLDQASFAKHFFGRDADDPVVAKLRSAAQGGASATTHAELRDAAGRLAEAIQTIGIDRWPRFLYEAKQKSERQVHVGALQGSISSPASPPDAIRSIPFGPVEAILGAGAVAAAIGKEGVVAGLSLIGKQIAKRSIPDPKPRVLEPVIVGRSAKSLQESGNILDPADVSGQLTRVGRALQKHGSRPETIFPSARGNPVAINKQGEDALKAIIYDPALVVKEGNRFGGFDIRSASGQGARFDKDGVFRGFLEPKQ